MTDQKARPTIAQQFSPVPLDELTQTISAFSSKSMSEKQAIIRRLVAAHPVYNLAWGPTWRYRRARLLRPNEVPATVDELIWRKGAPASLGRANSAGFQVLYLADRVDTAFREVRAVDHTAMIAEFEILPGRSIHIAPIGELARIQRTGRGYLSGEASKAINDFLNACDRDDAMSLLITDSFLLECLANEQDDYELSSTVAMGIFDKRPGVSVVAYPSRRQMGAMNFAVRVEQFWDNWGVVSVRRGRAIHLAQGYYRFVDTRHVDGITYGGALKWKDEVSENSTLLLAPPWTQRT